MKYPATARKLVDIKVTEWYKNDLYPKHWKLANQISGSYAENAAYIFKEGKGGTRKWLNDTEKKRQLLGNNPKQRDNFDMFDTSGEKIDIKFLAHNYNYIIVTPWTHAYSEYEALVAAKFDVNLENVEFYRISRQDFDSKSEDWISKNGLRKRIHINECEKVEKL